MAVTGKAEARIVTLAIEAATQVMGNGGYWSLVRVDDWSGETVENSDRWTDDDLHNAGLLFETTIRQVWTANQWND